MFKKCPRFRRDRGRSTKGIGACHKADSDEESGNFAALERLAAIPCCLSAAAQFCSTFFAIPGILLRDPGLPHNGEEVRQRRGVRDGQAVQPQHRPAGEHAPPPPPPPPPVALLGTAVIGRWDATRCGIDTTDWTRRNSTRGYKSFDRTGHDW